MQSAASTTTTNFNQNLAALRTDAEAHLVRAPRSLSRRFVVKQMEAVALRMEADQPAQGRRQGSRRPESSCEEMVE